MARTAPRLFDLTRRRVRVRGQVQGVGFRPFVYRVATELALSGWVRNDGEGVEIEVQGENQRIEAFVAQLAAQAPPLALVDGIETSGARPLQEGSAFLIDASRSGRAATGVTPDAAVCPECLAELFDPRERRYRYPFINCTHCGPRYTLTRALPYDRPQTSMAPFAMCAPCQAEYDNPRDRRFHAQPNACPDCGPQLRLLDADGGEMEADDVIAETLGYIAHGGIVAIKGLGGFHLACDGRNADAVARLRERKAREEKPLAVMVANVCSAAPFAGVPPQARALLESRERPIVLLRKSAHCDARLPGVAPGLPWLGAMLPYTPLHYLLFHEAAGRPAGTDWLQQPSPLALVMTSANPGGEPIVTGNEEALERLHGIADAFLAHDREILVRCDDSVVQALFPFPSALGRGEGDKVQFIRRARGYTPRAIKLAAPGASVLACGAFLKNTVCVTRGDEAFVSQHIGDLDNRATCMALEETVAHMLRVLEIEPGAVACDLHPDFFSTRFASAFVAQRDIPLIQIQHHHAHIAAVAAEHRIKGALLGLALDGVGWGPNAAVWGGELLRVEGARFERIGHLKELRLPGGDRAAREPWRMAAAALHALDRGGEIPGRFPGPAGCVVRAMLDSAIHAPRTSSAGRLFDAAAGLLGVKPVTSFEGQAAILLEGLAARHGSSAPMAEGFVIDGDNGVLSLLPLLARLADGIDREYGAALFHATFAEALAQWVIGASARTGLGRVALGGGCFLNRVLGRALRTRLEAAGIHVLEASQVPPNDGGLSLGQAWIAMNTPGTRRN